MNNKIAVIDLDSVAFTIGHPNKILDYLGNPKRTEDGSKFIYQDKTEDELIFSCNSLMNSILIKGKFTHYIGFIKGLNTISYKRVYDPEYKNDRKKETPIWWNFVKRQLIENWGAIESNNIEVDDACNITRINLVNSYLCCIDSDLLSLSGYHYNWSKNEWISTSITNENYSFFSAMITGSHNNTKGIPKKGIKHVEKVLQRLFSREKMSNIVFEEYIKYLGEENGIREFYKNYFCLKTLDKLDGFIIPEPIEFNKYEEEYKLVD